MNPDNLISITLADRLTVRIAQFSWISPGGEGQNEK